MKPITSHFANKHPDQTLEPVKQDFGNWEREKETTRVRLRRNQISSALKDCSTNEEVIRSEAAGHVPRVRNEVRKFQVGDRVVAFTPNSDQTFASDLMYRRL